VQYTVWTSWLVLQAHILNQKTAQSTSYGAEKGGWALVTAADATPPPPVWTSSHMWTCDVSPVSTPPPPSHHYNPFLTPPPPSRDDPAAASCSGWEGATAAWAPDTGLICRQKVGGHNMVRCLWWKPTTCTLCCSAVRTLCFYVMFRWCSLMYVVLHYCIIVILFLCRCTTSSSREAQAKVNTCIRLACLWHWWVV
jgi:hypothetical protein